MHLAENEEATSILEVGLYLIHAYQKLKFFLEEAEKIYKSIIKENNIKVGDASNKIKASTTHTAKVSTESKPLYESEEARRMKQLAGMSKRLED